MDAGFNKDYVEKFESTLSYTGANSSGSPGDVPADEHGNMCAYDASLAGSQATFLDMRLGDRWDLRLSDARDAYVFLTAKLANDPTIKTRYQGLVVSNSWSVGFKDDNLPVGSAERYFDNPNHFFTVAASELISAGADIVFAAGNAGDCSASPAGTIWGANSLDAVISVAAVDKKKARIYYSSEGPGVLSTNKPDISAFSEFFGSDDVDPDSGTSAAAAVVAGVVAAIRAQNGWGWNKSPSELKQHLLDIADKDVMKGGAIVTLTGWTREFGVGVARVQ